MTKFNLTATINHPTHMTNTLIQYGMRIGRELLHKLVVHLHFSTSTMQWQEVGVSMKELTCTKEETFYIEEEQFLFEETD